MPRSSSIALLIAAAGLWSRVRLVWWTTALAEAAYAALVLDAYARGRFPGAANNVNIVMGALALTGFVVAQHVKRIWAISSYYENRADPEMRAAFRGSVNDPGRGRCRLRGGRTGSDSIDWTCFEPSRPRPSRSSRKPTSCPAPRSSR